MAGAPPSPPPVVPVPDVATARQSAAEAETRLETTIRRLGSFSETERQQRVNEQWSSVESLRHLVLVIDIWLSKSILGERDPFDPIALPPTFMPPKLFPDSSIDPDARPSSDATYDVLRGRMSDLLRYVDSLTSAEISRSIEGHAGTVGGALSVLFTELEAHDRFINRDLDLLEDART
jgi:hypothetical protein